MRYIVKGEAPGFLEKYKDPPGQPFEVIESKDKEILRTLLATEQGYICCYCGQRIEDDENSPIEHLQPKGLPQYAHLTFEYTNLLCSCDGGESDRKGKSRTEKRSFPPHCDNKKNNAEIKITPLIVGCQNLFSFDDEGHISGNTTFAQETIDVLGLDCSILVNKRKAAIAAYKDLEYEPDMWNAEIEAVNMLENGKLKPFCFAVENYIREYKLFESA